MTIEGEKDMIEMKRLLLLGAALSLAVGCVAESDVTDEGADEGQQADQQTAGGTGVETLTRIPAFVTPGGMKEPAESVNVPGITYFQTYAVGSSNVGWEYVAASQTSTVANHGGAQLRVAVLQYGYGVANGSMSGTSGTRYATDNLCGPFSSLHYCSAGETITGFIYYFSFDGLQGGSFSAYSTSLGIPAGTPTDGMLVL